MNKVVISKNKLRKIESLLWAGFGAFAIVISMEGKTTNNAIKIRDNTVEDIMKLLIPSPEE